MTQDELNEVIENHQHWIKQDCEGCTKMLADLHHVDLQGANLRNADLWGANLYYANLRNANLRNADLWGANLGNADLRNADLWNTDLRNANLLGANLDGAVNLPFIPYACPEFGSFIGFKKARGEYIVTLEIPEDAKRLSATSWKCRCNKAKVLDIQSIDGSAPKVNEVASYYDKSFIYRVGETVFVNDFDEDRWNECSTGIHFFINREEAIRYR